MPTRLATPDDPQGTVAPGASIRRHHTASSNPTNRRNQSASNRGSSHSPTGSPAAAPTSSGNKRGQPAARRVVTAAMTCPVSAPNTAITATNCGGSHHAEMEVAVSPNAKPDRHETGHHGTGHEHEQGGVRQQHVRPRSRSWAMTLAWGPGATQPAPSVRASGQLRDARLGPGFAGVSQVRTFAVNQKRLPPWVRPS